VTAKHVAEDSSKKQAIACVVNASGGGVELANVGDRWFFHPNDETADVAVAPWIPNSDLDFISVSTKDFVTPVNLQATGIGIGDDVFIVGLFSVAPGKKRNMPILRHGTIAMLPDEQVQVEGHFADVYLVEARSIGGLSGSPVFVRKTVALEAEGLYKNTRIYGLSNQYRLLGLMHGHWDIRESELNSYSLIQDRQRGVNLGIGVVVPAHKIVEALNQPTLAEGRERQERAFVEEVSPETD
jgi:hypothetical protein